MKTKLFIDFDNTICETKKLKSDLLRIMTHIGVSQEDINEHYQRTRVDGFNPYMLAAELAESRSVDLKKITQEIRESTARAKEYIFPDAIEFLKQNKDRYETILLTFGNEKFQSEKVVTSGIDLLFESVIYTLKRKSDELEGKVGKDEKFIVIDDDLKALEEIKSEFPKSVVIGIDRYDEGESSNQIPAFKDFTQLNNYLKNG